MKRKRIIKPITKFTRIFMVVFFQFTLIAGIADYAVAQELNPSVISSGGETFIASGYSLDFVIGEIVTESYTEQGVMLSQGFLQGEEEGLSINEQTINAGDIDVYPNPSYNNVYIMYNGEEKPTRIEIYNIQACLVHSVLFENNPMAINLLHLNPGLYVLRAIFSNQNFVSQKIIKK